MDKNSSSSVKSPCETYKFDEFENDVKLLEENTMKFEHHNAEHTFKQCDFEELPLLATNFVQALFYIVRLTRISPIVKHIEIRGK